MLNKLFMVMNQFIVSNLYTIINKLFIKKIFLLVVSKVDMKLNKTQK